MCLLTSMQTFDITNFPAFAKVLIIGEPLSVPFCTSLNSDISGTRKEAVNGILSSFSSTFIWEDKSLSCPIHFKWKKSNITYHLNLNQNTNYNHFAYGDTQISILEFIKLLNF